MHKLKKSAIKFLLVMTMIHSCPIVHATDVKSASSILSLKAYVALFAMGAGILYYRDYIYNIMKNYLDNKIINETVDALYVIMTPNSMIENLPPIEREQKYREKARYINIRKRVITQLQKISKESLLSRKHSSSLNSLLRTVNTFFNTIDDLRQKNPYEDSYPITLIDRVTIKNLIDSIILTLKPNSECNKEELTKKEELAKRRLSIKNKLIIKITDKIINSLLKALATAIEMIIFLSKKQ